MKTKTAGQPWKDHDIRSPQAPGDIMPVDLADRHVSDLGFPTNVVDTLAEAGVRTVGDLLAAYPDEDFTAIRGVGPAKQEKAEALLAAYRS